MASVFLDINVVDDLDEALFAADGNTVCNFEDTDGCWATFAFDDGGSIDEPSSRITVKKTKDCPAKTSGFSLEGFFSWLWAEFKKDWSQPCSRNWSEELV